MKQSAGRILTTHVGSLARPDALVPILKAKDRGRIVRFARIVGRENVIAGADCSFAASASGSTTPTRAWPG
jgi:methionine synthase II (cobalamin-independent)